MDKIEITPELLADLKAKAEKATSGNWFVIGVGKNAYAIGAKTTPCDTLVVSSYYSLNERRVYGLPNKYDADHIAAANPQLVLSLISEIEQLRRRENFYVRAMAEYHQVVKMAWDDEILSPLPGHEYSEEKMIKQFEYLNCPACGGSGHVGDCDEAIQNLKCDLVNAQSKIKKLERELDGLCHDDTEKELKIERLEKEIAYMAQLAASEDCPRDCPFDEAPMLEYCAKCWREAAHNAVEKENEAHESAD